MSRANHFLQDCMCTHRRLRSACAVLWKTLCASLTRLFLCSFFRQELTTFRKKKKLSPSPARVVILVGGMLSRPVLNNNQVSSKYCEVNSSYRADTISSSYKKDNSKSKKTKVVIFVPNKSSRPVLYFYQVSSKYSKGYLCYRADMKSNSNTRKGDNSKSKKAKVFILDRDTSSCPVLHFYQVS